MKSIVDLARVVAIVCVVIVLVLLKVARFIWVHRKQIAAAAKAAAVATYAAGRICRQEWEQVISLWQQADKSRNKPKELLRLFGEGLSRFIGLPDNLKSYVGVYVRNALGEAGHIANTNKIRVTFSTEGAVFG